jgi:acyl-CoA hydrolase
VPSIADTRFQTVQFVFPEHTNQRGNLYGGRMMSWIATAGTLAASRFARRAVVLGAMDDLDFLAPIRLGEIVAMDAQVEFVGRSSLEVGVDVYAESPRGGDRRHATSSHLAFIALDDQACPWPVTQQLVPATEAEEALWREGAARRAARLARLRARRDGADVIPNARVRHGVTLSRIVRPEDALTGTLMFAGKLLEMLDEVAAITAVRYCRGATVTASLDTVYFYHPLRVGQIVDFRSALTHVARSSMEVGVRVDSEEPRTGARSHTCTAFLTMVHLDDDGKPSPVPAFTPESQDERRLWDEAERRIEARRQRVEALRHPAGTEW